MIFSEDPTDTWCYSRDRYHTLIGDRKLAGTFIDVATSALQVERDHILDLYICYEHPDYISKRLSRLVGCELIKLIDYTVLALNRPGFQRESYIMEELLYTALHNDLTSYLDGFVRGRRWKPLLKAMDCDDHDILEHLLWDFDFQFVLPTKEETRALRKELASL